MARYSASRRKRKRRFSNRNRTYLVTVIVLGVLAIVFYRTRSSGRAKQDSEPGPSQQTVAASPKSTVPVEAARQLAARTEPKIERAQQPAQPPTGQLPPPGYAAAPDITDRIATVMAFVNAHPERVIEARDKLSTLLDKPMNPQQQSFVRQQLSKLADKWLFSAEVYPGDTLCGTYQVKKGDLLRIIGARHKVPYEILMRINNIRRPQALRAGQTIKVPHGPFNAKVYRSAFRMDIYLQDTYVRSFPVGLGRPGRETPTGLWRVRQGGKLLKPTWTDPDTQRTYKATDRDYPLGSRWIALDGIEGQAKGRIGFAVHGTKDPDQIGTAGSRGCIRLHNGNAILVYDLLTPVLSKVMVVD